MFVDLILIPLTNGILTAEGFSSMSDSVSLLYY